MAKNTQISQLIGCFLAKAINSHFCSISKSKSKVVMKSSSPGNQMYDIKILNVKSFVPTLFCVLRYRAALSLVEFSGDRGFSETRKLGGLGITQGSWDCKGPTVVIMV